MTTLNLAQKGHHILLNPNPTDLITSPPSIVQSVTQARRTTSIAVTSTFTDVPLDTTDVETNSSVIKHDTTNTDNIDILQSGFYLIGWSYSMEQPTGIEADTFRGRIRINDTTVLSGSNGYGNQAALIGFGALDSNRTGLNNFVIANLTAGDFLTFQIASEGGTVRSTLTGPVVNVTKLDGVDGATGTNGIVFQGTWDPNTTYNFGDLVANTGFSYVANATNSNTTPPNTVWDAFIDKGNVGFTWQGEWTSTDFVRDDLVQFEGSTYVNILDTTAAQDPTDNTFWELYAQGNITQAAEQNGIRLFDAFHTPGGVSIAAGFTDIVLNTQRTIDTAAFSHTAGTAPVTILEAGNYVVSGRMTTDVTVGASRSTSEMKLQVDTGSGFVDIPATRGLMYNRISTVGDSSCRVTAIVTFGVGDIVKIQARRVQGTDTVVTRGDGCSLMLYKINTSSVDTKTIAPFFDDFIGSSLDNIWSTSTSGAGSSVALSTSSTGGKVLITSGTTINDFATLLFNTNNIRFSAAPSLRFRGSFSATTSTDVRFGFQVDTSNTIEFRYDTSLANVEAITVSGGTETAVDTGIAADTSLHNYEIIGNTSNTSVQYKIDSVEVATITTNIPTGLGHLFMRQESLAAASRILTIDFVEFSVNRV